MTSPIITLITRTSLLTTLICSANQASFAESGKSTGLDQLAYSESGSQASSESSNSDRSEGGNTIRSESSNSDSSDAVNQSSSEAGRQGGTESGEGFIHANAYPRPDGLPSGTPAYMRAPAGSDYVKSLPEQSSYAKNDGSQSSDYVKSAPQKSDYIQSDSSQPSDYVKSEPQKSDYVKSTDSP